MIIPPARCRVSGSDLQGGVRLIKHLRSRRIWKMILYDFRFCHVWLEGNVTNWGTIIRIVRRWKINFWFYVTVSLNLNFMIRYIKSTVLLSIDFYTVSLWTLPLSFDFSLPSPLRIKGQRLVAPRSLAAVPHSTGQPFADAAGPLWTSQSLARDHHRSGLLRGGKTREKMEKTTLILDDSSP